MEGYEIGSQSFLWTTGSEVAALRADAAREALVEPSNLPALPMQCEGLGELATETVGGHLSRLGDPRRVLALLTTPSPISKGARCEAHMFPAADISTSAVSRSET